MSRIHLVVGDTRPTVEVQLRTPRTNDLLDVSGAVVLLKVRAEGGDTVLFQLVGELLPGTLQANLIDADLGQYPVAGSGGRVRFGFIQGNLNLPPGRYVGDIEVVYGPANFLTAFPRLQLTLRQAA